MSDFDFLLRGDEARKRKRRPQCRFCRYFNKIPDHQLATASDSWANMGECWYRKEVLKKNPVVNKFWKPTWDCKFAWREMYKVGV